MRGRNKGEGERQRKGVGQRQGQAENMPGLSCYAMGEDTESEDAVPLNQQSAAKQQSLLVTRQLDCCSRFLQSLTCTYT